MVSFFFFTDLILTLHQDVQAAEDLFESEEEAAEEEAASAPKHSIWTGARGQAGATSDSDGDVEMAEAIADELVSVPLHLHSCRSSTGSGWSSGRDLSLPNTDPESDVASESESEAPPARKLQKVTAAHQHKANLEVCVNSQCD
ncbi:hypothetical protein K438DRAFT_433397 [Mycena galopus ATCC 62051]|nr:hypothetical protein K438DRAFT_433397 [Mycena galopus ATCC 62051]